MPHYFSVRKQTTLSLFIKKSKKFIYIYIYIYIDIVKRLKI